VSQSDDATLFAAERKRRNRLALILGAVVLVPVLYVVGSDLRLAMQRREAKLTAAQRAELTQLLDAREAAAKQRVEQWKAAARAEVLAALQVGEGECPHTLTAPTPVSAATYVKLGVRDSVFGAWSVCLLRPEQKVDLCALKHAPLEEDVKLRARLAEGDVYTWDLDAAKKAPPPVDPPRVVVLVETETPFKLREAIVGRLSYVPAALAGRAFLFLPAEGRVVCSAPVSAQNSKNVEAEFDTLGGKPSQLETEEQARGALQRDLEVRIRLDAAQAHWQQASDRTAEQ
jgi:hypothetical protein